MGKKGRRVEYVWPWCRKDEAKKEEKGREAWGLSLVLCTQTAVVQRDFKGMLGPHEPKVMVLFTTQHNDPCSLEHDNQ